ncbi:MAG: hypothetical protein ACRDRL_25430 [Sciscionella sp.]
MTSATGDTPQLTCFISAAGQIDVQPVVNALQLVGVSVRTSKEIAGGQDLSNSLISAVLKADFVCVVIDSGNINANVVFEAGVASGSRRPIVVASTAPPDTLRGSPLADMATIHYSKDDAGRTVLDNAIRAFVENVQPVAAQLAINWDELALQAGSRHAASLINAVGLERRVAERLARTGALVNTETDRRIDMIATFPSLGASIGRVPVEVKARFNKNTHQQNRGHLQRAMSMTDSLIGLLIYGEPVETSTLISEARQDALFEEPSRGILITSADRLDQWSDTELLWRLTQLRNVVIHSRP